MKDSTINVRPANIRDANDVAKLLTLLGYPATEEFAIRRMEILRSSGRSEIFVAELDGSIAGVMSFDVAPLFHQEGNIGCITSLSVDPKLQGQGVGSALVQAGEDFATKKDCLKISVASGFHRTEAHEFYRRLGYEESSKRFLKLLNRNERFNGQ